MARTELTKTTAGTPVGYSNQQVKIYWNTLNPGGDGEKFKAEGEDFIIVRNLTGNTGHIYIRGTADPYNRTEDLDRTLNDGQYCTLGPVGVTGWIQDDGFIYIDSDESFEVGIITLNG
jgi:hypothetical protein